MTISGKAIFDQFGSILGNKDRLVLLLGVLNRGMVGIISYGIIVLSYHGTSAKSFITYNNIVLCASISTIFSMPLMARIWNHSDIKSIKISITVLAILVISSFFILDSNFAIVASILYGLARFQERISYNVFVTINKSRLAMASNILFSASEIMMLIIFVLFFSINDNYMMRFAIPYTSLLVIFSLITFFSISIYNSFIGTIARNTASNSSTASAFVIYATLCVVVATLGDRWLVNLASNSEADVAHYLYVLGLSSTLLVLFTPIIDLTRPAVFAAWRDGEGLPALAQAPNVRLLFVSLIVVALITFALGLGTFLTAADSVFGISLNLLAWLSLGYTLFAIASFAQVIIYAQRQYRRLAGIWTLAIGVKLLFTLVAVLRHEILPWFPLGLCMAAATFIIAFLFSDRPITGLAKEAWIGTRGNGKKES